KQTFNVSHNINDEYEKKLEDKYIAWIIDFEFNLDKELNKLFLKNYISVEDTKVSQKLKKLILEAKKNMKKDRVKNKLTLFEYNKINNTLYRLDNINKLAFNHNTKKFTEQIRIMIKEPDSINNIKLLNDMINLYEYFIKSFPYHETNTSYFNHYRMVVFLEEIVTKYRSVQRLIKEYENIVCRINNKLSDNTLISKEDIKVIKRNTSLLERYVENNYILFSQILYSNEFKVIKSFNNYMNNLDNIVLKHNKNEFIEKTRNIFKERNSNNIKLLNDMINLYEDYIKSYPYNEKNSTCFNHYKVSVFLKEIVIKYGSIEGLIKKYENKLLRINNKLSDAALISEEDIKVLKSNTSLLKDYIENYDTLFRPILYKHELQIIKDFNNYINNLDNLVSKHNEEVIKLQSDSLVKKIKEMIYGDKDNLLKALNEYEYSSLNNIKGILKYNLSEEISLKAVKILKDNNFHDDLIRRVEDNLREFYNILDLKINKKNAEFIEREKIKYSYLFDNIEGKKLDNQQIEAIIKDEENSLIIAGAGSGKTITIIGKILYILEK
ncbi:MAG: UvrD-helicase domain-containing protein, partial [Clostridia bacterium]